MPEEQIGFGPAALEHPETDSFASKEESLAENTAENREQEAPVFESGAKYEKLLQSVGPTSQATTTPLAPPDDDNKADLDYLQNLEGEEEKVEHLVKLAQTKGLPHAVQVAARLKDYYALDVFHDTIADQFYDSLLKEGLITRE